MVWKCLQPSAVQQLGVGGHQREVEGQGGGGQKDVPEIGLGKLDSRSVPSDRKSERRFAQWNLGHHVIEPLRKALPYAKAFSPYQVVRFPNRHRR